MRSDRRGVQKTSGFLVYIDHIESTKMPLQRLATGYFSHAHQLIENAQCLHKCMHAAVKCRVTPHCKGARTGDCRGQSFQRYLEVQPAVYFGIFENKNVQKSKMNKTKIVSISGQTIQNEKTCSFSHRGIFVFAGYYFFQ